ncbi:MAG TPA: hypothetical protein VF157_16620 [Chloroflexota bacterium]
MAIRYAQLMGEITGLPPLPIADMGPPVLTPLARPLAEARVMILTSAGVHLEDEPPFRHPNDMTFRRLPQATPPERLRPSHPTPVRRPGQADVNVVFPYQRLAELEREGLPTVSLTSAIDITERVRPPRAAFLNCPLGYPVGRPHEQAEQKDILRASLGLVETAGEPGAIAELPFQWPDPEWEAETIRGYREEAHIVRDTRLKGEYDGDRNWAMEECGEVCSLA